MSQQQIKLIELYQEMADVTQPECANCRIPYHCCDAMYCQFTIEYAQSRWGVILEPTNHPKLPLMGEHGCTAAPHLRPMCTAHTCDLEKWGGKRNDADWNEQYWKLREEISALEFEL